MLPRAIRWPLYILGGIVVLIVLVLIAFAVLVTIVHNTP